MAGFDLGVYTLAPLLGPLVIRIQEIEHNDVKITPFRFTYFDLRLKS